MTVGGMKGSLLLAGLGGLGVAVTLFVANGLTDIVAAVGAVGWGLAVICLVRFLSIFCSAMSWRVLFPAEWLPPLRPVLWIRWVSESVNLLLPVAQIGGEVVRARLVSRRAFVAVPAVSGAQAGASVVADLTTGMAGTLLFSLMGVVLLLQRTTGEDVTTGVFGAMAAMLALLALFVGAQRSGLMTRILRWLAERIGGALATAVAGGTIAFEAALGEIYRQRGALASSTWWHFASWAVGAGEVWLALHFQGVDITIADALLIESILITVRSAAFAVPGGLGVQEGSLLVIGGLVGLSPQTALALALIKRVRELAVGLPALALWWAAESRGAVRQGA